jgi:MIP family channel proteins
MAQGLHSSTTGSETLRPAVGEFVGTFVLVFVGCSVAVSGVLQKAIAGSPLDSLAVALAFGLTLVAIVGALGHTSGGHVNPAVTLGQAAIGKFPWRDVPFYVGAQVAGAILAALAVWVCFGDAARDDANLAATALADGVSPLRGVLIEALVTFILVFVVTSAASDPRIPSAPVASLPVGFALAAGVFVAGPLTGGAVNPARALGPMLVSGQLDDVWVYIVGPLAGGVAGAFLAEFLLVTFRRAQ